jgi:hypothetical protein
MLLGYTTTTTKVFVTEELVEKATEKLSLTLMLVHVTLTFNVCTHVYVLRPC